MMKIPFKDSTKIFKAFIHDEKIELMKLKKIQHASSKAFEASLMILVFVPSNLFRNFIADFC